MAQQTSSKTLLGATEITLVADILPGFVPIAEVMTYSARLRTVLKTVFTLRKLGIERDGRFNSAGPLESLRMLHAVHWALLDDDRKLLLAVSFDGPWEPYIRTIVDVAGPLLDLIFCNCVGYRGHMCADGYVKFAEWVREHQQNCDFFYKGSPDLTVDDVRYLQGHERGVGAGYHVGPLQGQLTLAQRTTLAMTISGALESLFPPSSSDPSDDRSVFERARSLFVGTEVPVERADLVPTQADPDDTQGNILTSYNEQNPGELMTVGSVSLLHFEDAASGAGFLKTIIDEITRETNAKSAAVKLNVALTLRGLKTLGVSPAQLELLPPEFKQGMAARAGLLGDVAQNHPEHWDLPEMNLEGPSTERVNLATVDAIVMMEQAQPDPAGDPDPYRWTNRHPHYPTVKKWHQGGVQVLHVQALRRYSLSGHFDIKDGLSQPVPHLIGTSASSSPRDLVPLGEILTGYVNERGEPPRAELRDLLLNGSFLALRKIEQRVQEFETFVNDNAGKAEFVAKMVGRDREGRALIHDQTDNDFDYDKDANGAKCPLHAHIRRANPRSGSVVVKSVPRTSPGDLGKREIGIARTPRIMRRGMSYGPNGGPEPRGLMFMAYQASLADQYEVVQRWVNGGNSTGILSAHPDLLAGNFPERSNRTLSYPNADGSVTHVAVPRRPFTKLSWGIYAFAPAIKILRQLANSGTTATATTATPTTPPTTRGVATAAAAPEPPPWLAEWIEFDRHGPRDEVIAKWKNLLESRDHRQKAQALWQYIRQTKPLRTRYGVLVGSAQGVETVLATHGTFSVREYWKRLAGSFGGHYLGMDPEPKPVDGDDYHHQVEPGRYAREARVPNGYLASIRAHTAFHVARKAISEALANVPTANGRRTFPWRELGRDVIGRISAELFGMPDGMNMVASGSEAAPGESKSRCPLDFTRVSQLVFNPEPTPTLTAVADERGTAVRKAVAPFVNDPKPGSFCSRLRDSGFQGDLSHALIGAINGFVVPTSGAFLSALLQWIESEELWQLRRWLLADVTDPQDPRRRLTTGMDVTDHDIEQNKLTHALLLAMTRAPVPELLHRKVVEKDRSIEGVELQLGDRVVINLGSAAAHLGDWTLLFGGDYARNPRPLHACPGQGMALGVLVGMFTALLQLPNLRAEPGLMLSFDA